MHSVWYTIAEVGATGGLCPEFQQKVSEHDLQTGNDDMCNKIDLAGIRIDDCGLEEALQKVDFYFNNECMNTIETVTMKTIVAAGEDEKVRVCLEQTDLVLAGDKEILEMAGISSARRIQEVEDREFFHSFMSLAIQQEKTFFLLSQTEEEIEELQIFLEDLFDGKVQICGQYALDSCVGDEDDVINEINTVSPEIILSTLPTPKQEHFLRCHIGKFHARVWYGISAEYDVTESRRGLKVWLKKMQVRYKMKHQIQFYEHTSPENMVKKEEMHKK